MVQSIDDVARAAGVSTATVSRALRGLSSVKPETRERIERIALELGYSVSPTASRLASGRTQTIGLLTPWVNRWFFAHVIEGAQKALHAQGFDALLFSFHETPSEPRHPVNAKALRRRVDGLLVLGMQLSQQEVSDLESLGVPIVFAGPGHHAHTTVGVDDYALARLVMEHLTGLGHTAIGHLAGLDYDQYPHSPTRGRFRGWSDGLQSIGVQAPESWATVAEFNRFAGRMAAEELLRANPELTAIFAATDSLAIGAMQAVQDHGLVLGQDFSVVGVDDEDSSALVGLSTIRQNPEEQGRMAAELILQALSGQDLPLQVHGDISLVKRSSSGRLQPSKRN